MKKFLIGISLMLFAFNVNAITKPDLDSGKKVTIYLFEGEGCAFCTKAITYFAGLGDEYDDYFELVAYEVWKNQENVFLLEEVKKEIDREDVNGVPFIMIGRDFQLVGFDESRGEAIINAALEAYQDEDYEDVVKLVSEKTKGDYTKETLKEVAEKSGVPMIFKDESSNKDAYIILSIFGVILLAIGGLIVVAKKQQ